MTAIEAETLVHSAPTSIATHVESCLKAFSELCAGLQGSDRANSYQIRLSDVKDELGRFGIWSGDIGAHRTDRSSLSYRLRDASHLKVVVIGLLADLEETLRDASEIIHGEKVPWEELSDSDSDSDFTISENDPAPEEEANGPMQATSELQQLMSDVVEVTTCLLRLSMAIRNPAPHDQFMDSSQINTSYLESFDISHVQAKFPGAEEYLIMRLGKAISRRRQYLKYRDEHHKKLAQGIENNLDESVYSDDGLSQVSYATSANESTKLQPPPIPKDAQDGKPFECPLCFMIISIRSPHSWKEHVYEDLHSYVCTFEDCNTPDRLFESRHEWFDHEMQAHRRWWQCVEGCDKPFHSKLSFEAHLQHSHADLSGGAHLSTLMRMCERKANMDTPSDCSLCHHPFTSLVQLRRHMGQHHEQLALFAIPSNLDQTEEDAFEAGSINEAEIDSIGSGRTNSEVNKGQAASDKEIPGDVQVNEFHEASGVRVGRLLSLAFPQRECANVFTLQGQDDDRTNEPEENNDNTTTNDILPKEWRVDVNRGKWRADVGREKWKAPRNNFDLDEEVYIKKIPRGLDGPWTIIRTCRPTSPKNPDWKYDLRHADGRTRISVIEDDLG